MGMLDQLIQKGFATKFAAKSLLDLGMDAKRVARFVRGVPADAWIVCAGSHDVLEWFREESLRAFAFFGGWSRTPIPALGVRKDLRPVISQLVKLGHRRIVMLARGVHWQPNTSLFMRNFLDALRSEGIEPSAYHIPTFGYHPEDLHHCLDSLFKANPPTALFVSEAYLMIAVRDYLARRGILAPRDISLICFDHDHSYPWCVPVISHFAWDDAHVTRRVARWVTNVARGKDDRRQTFIMAKFIKGGTIGPAPRKKPRI
jgi:DNA-binding LacI/PurR family transcriptional regulator